MSVILAMCLFSLSMSISPGPVNLITLSTGVNHGFRNAMPFVSGATIGFTLLLILIGAGLGGLALQNDGILDLLGYCGAALIGYMGYKIASAKPSLDVRQEARPSFIQGVLLQWLNPKAWMACLAGVSAFSLSQSVDLLAIFVSIYFVICYLSIASWALLGERIHRLFRTPKRLRLFNLMMGGGLICVAFYLLALQLAAG